MKYGSLFTPLTVGDVVLKNQRAPGKKIQAEIRAQVSRRLGQTPDGRVREVELLECVRLRQVGLEHQFHAGGRVHFLASSVSQDTGNWAWVIVLPPGRNVL